MLINIDEYRKARNARSISAHRSNAAPTRSAQTRAVQTLLAPQSQPAHELSLRLPDDLTSIDVDAYVARLYALASQI